MFPIFYINLDRSVERNNEIINTLTSKNIVNYRVSGIDLQNIDKNALYDGVIDDIKYHVKNTQKCFGKKEIAIILSHIKCLKKIVESEYDICVVCEDDTSFEYIDNWNETIDDIIKHAPKNWKILKLHTSIDTAIKNNIVQYNKKINYLPLYKEALSSAGCYIIKKSSAIELLNKYVIDNIYTFPKSDEYVVCECIIFSLDNIYIYTKPIICVRDNNSASKGGYNILDIKSNIVIHNFWNPEKKLFAVKPCIKQKILSIKDKIKNN